jgi:RND family efflux transporter MFP subunit
MKPLETRCMPALLLLLLLPVAACKESPHTAAPAAGPQALPVQVEPVSLSAVPSTETYVATIKSRRSATIQPQIDGNLTRILVKSGDAVKAGQLLMTIDPLKQQATVQQQRGTELQAKTTYDYNKTEENRQKQLFDAGIISRSAYDQAIQNLGNSIGAYNAAVEGTRTQQQQLAYYQIRAPFAGVVGDIPVHLGDYVSPTTLLTTVDENSQLEAYIYIPTERAGQVRLGLPVDILDTNGSLLAHSKISFLSPQVDNGTQTILAKAEVPSTPDMLRNEQLVKARVTWSSAPEPVVPVLAVTRIGGQAFVFIAAQGESGYTAHQVAVTLGDTVGNNYPVLSGIHPGDKVIISGLQMLQEGMPVHPIG